MTDLSGVIPSSLAARLFQACRPARRPSLLSLGGAVVMPEVFRKMVATTRNWATLSMS